MLGTKIQHLRNNRSLSLKDLAEKAGIPVDILKSIESGDIFPVEYHILLKIADALLFKTAADFMALMDANKQLKFKAYNVGIGKTGTLSMATIFGNYRSEHQFEMTEILQAIKYLEKENISREQFVDCIMKRDLKACLEMDSSGHHFFYLDILAEKFPEAKFIFVIRDCYSWFDSVINMLHLPNSGFTSPGKYDFDHLKPICEDKTVLISKLPEHIEGPLGFWAEANQKAINTLPRDRSLMIRTHEISQRIDKIADFIGIPADTLIRERSHTNKGRTKLNILHAVDGGFFEEKVNDICSPLMKDFFPGYSLSNYLNKNPIPRHPEL